MRSPLARLQVGLVLLAATFVVAVVAYRVLGYPWLEAVWMVVITIASVGYGERSSQPPAVQAVTVVVILVGFTAAAYTFGGLLQLLLAGELELILGRSRMQKDIQSLSGHNIVVGFGRLGRILAADLARRRQPLVIIERDAGRCREVQERQLLYLEGNATEDELLVAAGVERARSLTTALPNDADNVFITLTARNLNPQLLIVARAEHASSERKLRQAGANRIVMPSTIGAQQMARMITRPHTADLMELIAEQDQLDVEIDELRVAKECPLAGRRLRDSEIHHRFQLLVLALKRAAGGLEVSPAADTVFAEGDILIVLGPTEQIKRFRTEFRL